MYQRFKLDRGRALTIDVATLWNVSFGLDLEGFLAAWDHTLMVLKKPPDDDLLLAWNTFFLQM